MMKLPVFPLLYTEMVFVKGPGRPSGLKVTLIWAFFPGAIGSFGHSGVVHPQEAITRVMTKGISPVLDTSNVWDTFPSASLMVPKSKLVVSAEITAFF